MQEWTETPENNVCIITGELSGDLQASHLLPQLKKELEHLGFFQPHFWGATGPSLALQGVESVLDISELSVMGFTEVLANYQRVSTAYKKLVLEIERRKPKAVILVDFPSFNMRLAEDAFLRGATVIGHIPAKAWAHGKKRVVKLRDRYHLITCVLPFEEPWLKNHNVNAVFVGNPLFDAVKKFKKSNQMQSQISPVVGLLPGSRKAEIKYILPVMVEALIELKKLLPNLVGILPVAKSLDRSFINSTIQAVATQNGVDDISSYLELCESSYDAMNRSQYAWVCSGTATLETAFMGTPQGVIYKTGWLTYEIAKRIITVDSISLVNLCAEKKIVEEFVQEEASKEALVNDALRFLNSQFEREKLMQEYLALDNRFEDVSENFAAKKMAECIVEYAELPMNLKEKSRLMNLERMRKLS